MQRCRYCNEAYDAPEQRLRCETLHILRKKHDRTGDQPQAAPRSKKLSLTDSGSEGQLILVPKALSKPSIPPTASSEIVPDSPPTPEFLRKPSKGKRRSMDDDTDTSPTPEASDSEAEEVDYNKLDGGDGSDEDVYELHLFRAISLCAIMSFFFF